MPRSCTDQFSLLASMKVMMNAGGLLYCESEGGCERLGPALPLTKLHFFMVLPGMTWDDLG